MRSLRGKMIIGFFLSWYRTLRESRKASEIGLGSCYNLSFSKWIMSSAVAISNKLEQVCSLAHLKASREAEIPLRISNSLLDITKSIMLNSLRRLVMGVARSRYRSTMAAIIDHFVFQSRIRLKTVTSECFWRRERIESILTRLFRTKSFSYFVEC